MFVYPPGSGFTGVPQSVHPGDDLFKIDTAENVIEKDLNVMSKVDVADGLILGVMQHKRKFNEMLKPQVLDKLGFKNFSPETMKKVKWATKMYREWRMY